MIFLSLLAALPPFAQRIREIQEILSSRELAQIVHSGEWVRSITQTGEGYLVSTDQQNIYVKVEYLGTENGCAGPQKYRLVFMVN